ncbi:tRNA(His) guanylyltransferase Thg1 family protein [Tautonia rosea]|uniref:tRNA(His) guanylyltransferase Thg1 family protein n=1 Tax=Tautonia rosea TaxID=2728037 RepID=UPI001475BA57|nr:tRNA(His) guanylyltransferase Thg1 family protein [Tautonia rosea]
MKGYEARATGRFMPMLPVVCRVDGRNFSRWTRGLRRPFDPRLTRLMIETARQLVLETGAVVAFTQSDEISLVLLAEEADDQLWFGAKQSKITRLLAATTTGLFNRLLPELIPEKVIGTSTHEPPCPYATRDEWWDRTLPAELPEIPPPCSCGAWSRTTPQNLPCFDARAFSVPNLDEAANAMLWREIDATRNSLSMLAQHHYDHQALMGKGRAEVMELLRARGVHWNRAPASFKRGTYLRRSPDRSEVGVVVELNLEPLRTYPHEERVRLLFR